jgi:hypothetical protein
MPEKTTKDGRTYRIDGKAVYWPPEDDDGVQGNLPEIRIPLRLKMKTVLSLGGRAMDNTVMNDLLAAVIPDQADALGEMDVNDFQDMFATWQSEYNTLTGASLGESSGSSA